jgi:peptidoglycan/LPS O-acetylase OafA/YrhL
VERASSPSTRSSRLYLPTFDGIRGLVIVAIVLAHLRLVTNYVPNHDAPLYLARGLFASVDFLLAISAFMLFLPVAASGRMGSRRAFALKRIGRIVPNYYLALTAAVLFMTFTSFGPAKFLPAPEPTHVLWHMLFIQTPMGAAAGFGVVSVLWVLSIIVVFYLLMPLIALPFLRHPFRWIVGGLVIAVLWRAGISQSDGRLYIEFPLFLDDFVIGMGGALAYVKLRELDGVADTLRRISIPVALVAGASLLVFMALGGRGVQLGTHIIQGEEAPISIGIALSFVTLVVATAFMPAWAQWPLSNRFSRWLGEISYGVFLYHILIAQAAADILGLRHAGNVQAFLELAAVVLPLSLLASWVSYVTVERPMRERIRKFAERYEPTAGSVSDSSVERRSSSSWREAPRRYRARSNILP